MADADKMQRLFDALGLEQDDCTVSNALSEVERILDHNEDLENEVEDLRAQKGVMPERDALALSGRLDASGYDANALQEMQQNYDQMLADQADQNAELQRVRDEHAEVTILHELIGDL